MRSGWSLVTSLRSHGHSLSAWRFAPSSSGHIRQMEFPLSMAHVGALHAHFFSLTPAFVLCRVFKARVAGVYAMPTPMTWLGYCCNRGRRRYSIFERWLSVPRAYMETSKVGGGLERVRPSV